jgi:hypothetical protein
MLHVVFLTLGDGFWARFKVLPDTFPVERSERRQAVIPLGLVKGEILNLDFGMACWICHFKMANPSQKPIK